MSVLHAFLFGCIFATKLWLSLFLLQLSLRGLSRKAFLQVDRRLGFNLLQAAVFEGDCEIFFKAMVLFDNFVKEMNFKTAENDDKFFSGMSAVDILSILEEKGRGHAKIDEWYQEEVEKIRTFTELHWCRCNDDAEKAVELVLNDDVDVDIPALCNRTPLLWASISSSSMLIKTLIDLGADVNVQRTDDKVAPLMLAADWQNYLAVRLLLEHGADINMRDKYGRTPLYRAVRTNHETLVKLSLERKADVCVQDTEGDSPLHFSVRGGFFEVSRLLIEAGCNINVRNKSQQTPLYIAVEKTHEQLVTLLLANGADVHMQYKEDPSKRIYLVRGKDRGKPAWHYVLVEKLLFGLFLKRTRGGSLDVKDFGKVLKSGWGVDPPVGTIDKILEDGGDIFKEIPGETLLHVATRNNNTEIIELLVDFGSSDVNIHDKEGFAPLHIAAIRGNMHAVKKLVELGADVNQALPVGEIAHVNEELGIEEYLKSKMGVIEGSGEREDEQDIAPTNRVTVGTSFESNLESSSLIGNSVQREREGEKDTKRANRATGPSFESTLERLRSIGNTIKREGLHFLEAVGAAAIRSNTL